MPMSEPLVSVVIATYRRADLLKRCLLALCRQRMDPRAFEIIVADDGCEPAIAALVAGLAAQYRAVSFHYTAVPATQGPAGARNAGARLARGEILAFTDDDTIPSPDWVCKGYLALASKPGWCAAAGCVVVPTPTRPTDHERDTAGLASAEFVTANCFVRASAFARVDGFDERFTRAWREDSDLQFRLEEVAGTVGRAEDAVVEHPVRPAEWGASARAQAKVFFDALLYKKHPRQYRRRIRPVPPWSYYAIVACAGVALVAMLGGAAHVAAVAAAGWAMLTAAFCARRLRGASWRPGHVWEMVATSIVIPPLSLYWRLRGALAFRTGFL
ncbi:MULTISPECIES: glycosyltransferase family A protein [unclassified Cupriavidus]|uniref:glycosyltransferase family 2 protein n=1 Tax=unclassified Cupriavidus TaxID=2640874 RepID=UPI001C007CBE|nr:MULTISPECIES: glycosyltransferase family A protein [unclassified Cupriavidus]MCA3188084.1 glycosyltransferase family 2 protein [Cupriavidus sp.]MCA3191848.1 glycosyltransferase family 2 protein [Cupriavidus sp.]MCA3198079.1 glycosyltransferase family 2 protein [Cupriavidus sp.]MCA3200761.1 glycosyltransferase family 2 protein [Cupriavidus sp.]MCA3207796.1 glycosyltransferase family 2 protein [Cupriavidus sp.]